jgi:hypothetical protein
MIVLPRMTDLLNRDTDIVAEVDRVGNVVPIECKSPNRSQPTWAIRGRHRDRLQPLLIEFPMIGACPGKTAKAPEHSASQSEHDRVLQDRGGRYVL